MGVIRAVFCDLCKRTEVYLSTTISWSQIGNGDDSHICPPCAGLLLAWWKEKETHTPEEIEKKKQKEAQSSRIKEEAQKKEIASQLSSKMAHRLSLKELQSLLDKEK
jgi:hypothetical protein